jgi:hypothetical protein
VINNKVNRAHFIFTVSEVLLIYKSKCFLYCAPEMLYSNILLFIQHMKADLSDLKISFTKVMLYYTIVELNKLRVSNSESYHSQT